MRSLFSNDYGEYLTGFFVIKLGIELKEGISPIDFSTEELATFVHEYVHFLQNITTTCGLTYFNDNSKFIQLFISESYKYDRVIPYPLSIEKSGVENAYEESELCSFYFGDGEHKKIHHINEIKIEDESIMELVIPDVKFQAVNIYYDDKENPYMFGNTCIEESMAYLIENQKFSGLSRSNELPYNSCELVCKSLFPDLEIRKEIIVVLAELALMHYHGGMMFVELVKYLVEEKKDFKDTNEVVKYFRNKVPHLFCNFKKAYNETENSIDFLYPKNTPFNTVNTWIKKEIKTGFGLRNNYYNLLSRIMDLSVEQGKRYLSSLLCIFGYPVICDENGGVFSGDYDLNLALVPISIFNEYNSNETNCYLYKYCHEGKNPLCDDNCNASPWLQSEKEKLCPFGIFWYHYSLSGKIMQKNSDNSLI